MTPTKDSPARLRLRYNFSWTFIGNVIYAGCWFAMTIVLAQLGSPEHVGLFTLGLAVSAPVFMFATMRLRDIQATDTNEDFHFGDYLALRLVTTVLAFFAVGGIVLAVGFQRETSLVVMATALSKSVEAISDTFYGLFMKRERLDRIAKSMMLKGPLSLVALSIAFQLTGSVFGGVMALASMQFAVLVGYDLRNLRSSLSCSKSIADGQSLWPRPRWNAATMKRLTWLALPLGFVKMLISFNINIPRWFIASQFGAYQLGIFAAVAAFQKSAPTVVQALGQSASPRLAKYYAAEKSLLFFKLTLTLVSIGVLLGCIGVLVAHFAGTQILTLFYGAEYALPGLFSLLMLAAAFDYVATMLLYSVMSARYFKIQLPLHLCSSGSIAIACWLFIPIAGLNGAAIALLIGSLVRVVGSLMVVVYAYRSLVVGSRHPALPRFNLQTSDAVSIAMSDDHERDFAKSFQPLH